MGIKTRLQDKRMDKKLFVRLAYDSLMSDELKMACRDVLVNGFTQGEAARDLEVPPSVVSRAVASLLAKVPKDGGPFATNYEVLTAWWRDCIDVVPGAMTMASALRADLDMYTGRRVSKRFFSYFLRHRGFEGLSTASMSRYGTGMDDDPGPKLRYMLPQQVSQWAREAVLKSSGQRKATPGGWIDPNTRRPLTVDQIPLYMRPALNVPDEERPRFVEPRPQKPRPSWGSWMDEDPAKDDTSE